MDKVELDPKGFFDDASLVAEMSKEMEVRRNLYKKAKLDEDVAMMNPQDREIHGLMVEDFESPDLDTEGGEEKGNLEELLLEVSVSIKQSVAT